eukprot:796426_1
MSELCLLLDKSCLNQSVNHWKLCRQDIIRNELLRVIYDSSPDINSSNFYPSTREIEATQSLELLCLCEEWSVIYNDILCSNLFEKLKSFRAFSVSNGSENRRFCVIIYVIGKIASIGKCWTSSDKSLGLVRENLFEIFEAFRVIPSESCSRISSEVASALLGCSPAPSEIQTISSWWTDLPPRLKHVCPRRLEPVFARCVASQNSSVSVD